MPLTDEDRRFLAKRIQLVRAWPYVGAMLLALPVGLSVWLWLSVPLLIDPLFAMTRLSSDALPESTMALMAAMLPVAVLLCLALALAAVLFVFAAFSNEKKYLQIIRHAACEQDAAVDEML